MLSSTLDQRRTSLRFVSVRTSVAPLGTASRKRAGWPSSVPAKKIVGLLASKPAAEAATTPAPLPSSTSGAEAGSAL